MVKTRTSDGMVVTGTDERGGMIAGHGVLESPGDAEESRRMTSPARQPEPDPAIVARSRPRSHLTLVDRLVRVPIGFLYLIFIALLAIPVMTWMTVLHFAVRGWDRILAATRRGTTGGTVKGERGA